MPRYVVLRGEMQEVANKARGMRPFNGAILDRQIEDYIRDELNNANEQKIELLDMTQLDAEPTPSYLVPGLLPSIGTSMTYAKYASYKSFLALDLSMAVAMGGKFAGLQCEQGPVLYFLAEGGFDWPVRVIASAQERGWRRGEDVPAIFTVKKMLDFTRPDIIDKLAELVEDKMHGDHPAMIVIDTLAKSTGGEKENDTEVGSRLTMVGEALSQRLECQVMFIHHSGKDETKGSRGASSIPSGVDTIWQVKKDANDTFNVTLTVEKNKSGREGEQFDFRMQTKSVVTGPDKITRSTLVPTFLPEGFDKRAKPLAPNQQKVMSWLDTHRQGGPHSTATIATATKIGKSTVHAALKVLVELGNVEKIGEGMKVGYQATGLGGVDEERPTRPNGLSKDWTGEQFD